jgi:hypothetical protein
MNDLTDRLDAFVVVSLVLLLGGILAALVFVPIPKDNVELFSALASGVVGAGVGAYVGYRFGSSKGSAAKDQTISALSAKVPSQ